MEPLFRTIIPPYRLGEFLLRIAERRLVGRLVLTSDLGERTIYFHTGFPVFAHSSRFSERLGAVGVRYGILRREAVADALALAREQGTEIGRALLELEHVNGCQLFRLLGAQLIEQLAASCAASPARARFYVDPEALAKTAILRVHPMTAVLATVRHMPQAEQAKMLSAVTERMVVDAPLPELARQWLADLGYIDDPTSLLSGPGTTVGTIRSRLVAKLRSTTQQDFDPSASPVPLDVRKEDSARPPARSVADYITLALLLSGTVKLADTSGKASAAQEGLPNTAASLQATLDGSSRSPLSLVPENAEPEPSTTVDNAIRLYLEDRRDARTAARTAIWGPSAEIADDPALTQLLTLYLTLKPEPSDAAVLNVKTSDPPSRIANAHATYCSFLDEVSLRLTTPHPRARIAELRKRIDDALYALAPSLEPRSERASQPATEDGTTPSGIDGSSNTRAAAHESSDAEPAGPRPELSAEALLQSVEARVREGSWQKVVDLIEPVGRGRSLPPTLSLARTIAQRELTKTPQSRSWRRVVVALLIGLAAGYALGQLDLLPFHLR